MMKFAALCAALMLGSATAALGQSNVDLGGMRVDNTAPIEVTADSLSVDQDSGEAVFDGSVMIQQGDLRITAGRVAVVYGADTSEIAELRASGGVTFVTPDEAAEAQDAVYVIATGILTLSGDVLLTQGASAISAGSMVIDVTKGTATMQGRVRTVLQQGDN